MDSTTISFWTGPFPVKEMCSFILTIIIELIVLNTNSTDPDQTPRSAASDLGLHCLPMSVLWDARHKWVKNMEELINRISRFSLYFMENLGV